MNFRWLFLSALVQTCMFLLLILYVTRLEDRMTARLAAVDVALLDLRMHMAKDVK